MVHDRYLLTHLSLPPFLLCIYMSHARARTSTHTLTQIRIMLLQVMTHGECHHHFHQAPWCWRDQDTPHGKVRESVQFSIRGLQETILQVHNAVAY